jgi:TetR/AcrR family tetracycline transcriptional repressor
MTENETGEDETHRRRQGLRRGAQTTDRIVSEALRILDEDGITGFSLPKLGKALGADPTAIYRHFPSKDDLVLAVADRLIEESTSGLEHGPCWITTLMDLARRLRSTYLRHPAAATLCSFRTTQRPAEMRAADIVVGAVLEAGFEGIEAATVFKAIADFGLAWAGLEASYLALDRQRREKDDAAWASAYQRVGEDDLPNIWRIRQELVAANDNDDEVFETVLTFVVGGLTARAPKPCSCAMHSGRAR